MGPTDIANDECDGVPRAQRFKDEPCSHRRTDSHIDILIYVCLFLHSRHMVDYP